MPLDAQQLEAIRTASTDAGLRGARTLLLAERELLLAMLREVEWRAGGAGGRCPVCYGRKPGTLSAADMRDPGLDRSEGHGPGCRLGELLR